MSRRRETLVAIRTKLWPQLIQTHPYGRPIEPSPGILSVDLWIPPEFPEDVDGQLFGASRIPDQARDYARHTIMVRVEKGVESGRACRSVDRVNHIASSIHTNSTPPATCL